MRRTLVVALLGCTSFTAAALAQSPTGSQGSTSGQQAACHDLINQLRDTPIDDRLVSIRQARDYRQSGDSKSCQTWLSRMQTATSRSAEGRSVTGPDITVRQQQPQITVQRARPEITIEQRQPTITIDMPPPTVTVRTGRPDVNVVGSNRAATSDNIQISGESRPTVHFQTVQPRVVIRKWNDQPQVNYERGGDGQLNQTRDEAQEERTTRVAVRELIDMEVADRRGRPVGYVNQLSERGGQRYAVVTDDTSNGDPRHFRIGLDQLALHGDTLMLRQLTRQQLFSRGERLQDLPAGEGLSANARVSLTTIASTSTRGDEQSDTSTRQQADTPASQPSQVRSPQTASNPSDQARMRNLGVDRLLEMSVYDEQGNLLGDVERVVEDNQGTKSIVFGHGGFLGIGEKQIAISLDQLRQSGDRLTATGMTESQIQSMPEWSRRSGTQDLDDNQDVQIRQM